MAILYLDTSALVKLYVEEEGSNLVRSSVAAAEESLTSIVTYAEARAALARARRERVLTPAALRGAVDRLEGDWLSLSLVHASERLVRRAGPLAERYGLRGFDAIHLASALEATRGIEACAFGCFDDRLMTAAQKEGFRPLRG